MGFPAKKMDSESEQPPIDPDAIPRAYERERARRRVRQDRKKARKRAHLRFYVTMLCLLVFVGAIALLVLRATHSLFGI